MNNKLATNLLHVLKRANRVFIYAIVFLLSLYAEVAVSEGFRMINVGSHEEPMLDDLYATYVLPGTSIKVGIYDYETDGVVDIRRLGFLVDSKKFFYIDGEYTFGDVHYGRIGNYFVVDGWKGDGSSPNRLMVLCQFDKASVQLLDSINASTSMNFASVTNDTRDPWKFEKNPAPSWMEIGDIDHDGIPEIKLQIVGYDFLLYMEIRDGHFRIDFDPELYAPLFEKAKQKISASKRKRKTDAYYVYGFLSKKLDIKDIGLELKHGESKAGEVIPLLEKIGDWDASFHELLGEHFEMKQLEMGSK